MLASCPSPSPMASAQPGMTISLAGLCGQAGQWRTYLGTPNFGKDWGAGFVPQWEGLKGSARIQNARPRKLGVARCPSLILGNVSEKGPANFARGRRDLSVKATTGGDGSLAAETRAEALRKLLTSPGIHQGPACHDALSARLVEMAGFSFTFMSGFAVSTVRLAAPDAGLISYGEMVDQGCFITSAVTIPVIGDADTGYGNALNVKRTVKGYIAAGFAGILLEDQVAPKACGHTKGRQVVARNEAVMRIRAAVDARKEARSDIVIVARSDARQAVSLDEALWRVQAFADAGADVLFVDALASQDEMRAFCNVAPGVPKMANMLEGGGKTPILSPLELDEIGFKLIAYPLSLIGVSIRAMQDALTALKSGRLPPPKDLPSFDTIQEVVGFPQYYAEEERYTYEPSTSTPAYESLSEVLAPSSESVISITEEVTVIAPDQVLEAPESSQTGEKQENKGAGSTEAEVLDSLSNRNMRSSFPGIWASSVRVKITGNNGAVKLDVCIPAGFLEGLSNTIPAIAGLDLRLMLEKAQFNFRGRFESGQNLVDFTDPNGDRVQVILE